MKRAVAAVALLAVMVALGIWHVAALSDLVGGMEDLLVQAEAQAERGEWQEAEKLTLQAKDRWKAKDFYLHVALRHEALDDVDADFGEVLELLRAQEEGEYSAVNARLKIRLYLLADAERAAVENLF